MSTAFLYPGQINVSKDSDIIRTILGSCVAVVLWDERNRIGGMCHYLLADAPPKSAPSGRYGVFAVDMLLEEMLAAGADRNGMTAQVFGGGAVVDAFTGGAAGIGDKNIQCAEDALLRLRISVTARNVAGKAGRRIAIDTTTGKTLCDVQGEGESTTRTGVVVAAPKALVKVLIVDDSATLRTILKSVFDRSKKITVVGTATDPFDARDKIIQLKPDVLTLDIEMPRMNGIQFLEKLMIHQPMPVVVVSSLSAQGPAAARALELGAIDFVHKPSQFDPMVLSDLAETLIPKVIGASTADVKATKKVTPISAPTSRALSSGRNSGVSVIGIGGNGGSSDPLVAILKRLPTDTPPVIIAVPTIAGFAATWIAKYQKEIPIKMEVATANKMLQQGVAYICSADEHVKVVGTTGQYHLETLKAPPVSGQRPSSDILFDSLADQVGPTAVAVLLSGYGKDGAQGMGRIRDGGGWTICQDPQDCSFNFCVTAAIESGVASEVATRDLIAERIYDRRSASLVR